MAIVDDHHIPKSRVNLATKHLAVKKVYNNTIHELMCLLIIAQMKRNYIIVSVAHASLSTIVIIAHMRVHDGYCPFKCKSCNRRFRFKSQLKNHLKKNRSCRISKKFVQCTDERGNVIWMPTNQ